MPASAVVALARVGFFRAEVKPFGPVHAYVAPATVGVESAIVPPAQYGPPLLAVGVAGGVQVGQAPGPAVVFGKPETVPLNCEDVVVPVVLTTITKFDRAGTGTEYVTVPSVVPSPVMPLSPRRFVVMAAGLYVGEYTSLSMSPAPPRAALMVTV